MSDIEIFKLAKVIWDARVKECYFGKDRVQIECNKFPETLTPRNYVTPQPWIDVALAQARAVAKYLKPQV